MSLSGSVGLSAEEMGPVPSLPTPAGENKDMDDPSSESRRGGGEDSGDEGEEDEVPDYRMLAGFAEMVNKSTDDRPVIPKRGEKDFEPTGHQHQVSSLQASRMAMFSALRGVRKTSSKALSIATWDPNISRAIIHTVKGGSFTSSGLPVRYPLSALSSSSPCYSSPLTSAQDEVTTKGQDDGADTPGKAKPPTSVTRLELFPEEALYLIERGALECYRNLCSDSSSSSSLEGDTAPAVTKPDTADTVPTSKTSPSVPMSVQQAFAEMLNRADLTPERYQVYAYLRRLGYHVLRARVPEHPLASRGAIVAVPVMPSKEEEERLRMEAAGPGRAQFGVLGASKFPKGREPVPLVTIWDVLLFPARKAWQWVVVFWRWIAKRWQHLVRTTSNSGRRESLVGPGRWRSYDQVFSRLRLVPSSHRLPLFRSASSTCNEDLPELPAEDDREVRPVDRKSVGEVGPFDVFYHAWRPGKNFKKTAPGPPEFRIVVVDARTTNLPDIYQFSALFDSVPVMPLPPSRGAASKPAITTDISSSRYLSSSLFLPLISIFSAPKRGSGASKRPRPPPGSNPFPALKAGRKNVVFAIVDQGTTSLLRFGEAEFGQWPLLGAEEG